MLEDGTVVSGTAFGARKTVFGELVFNTGMTGYQEALTDPSYNGQILMFTYPLIGNYGINSFDFESSRVWVRGVVVREHCKKPEHRYSKTALDKFLKERNVPGICDVDTRELTIKTRAFGTLRAAISTDGMSEETLLETVREMGYPDKSNLVHEVSCGNIIYHNANNDKKRIVLIDCGVKQSILRYLLLRFNVVQVPYNTPADIIHDFNPSGIVLSNGPGNPAHEVIMKTVVETVRNLQLKLPIFGICLGHQILALAFGAKTYKLKFGHRGANHPVKDLATGKITITSQNHGFAVELNSLPSELEITHINVNDGTIEGFCHKALPIISLQYHPEGAPGPWDSRGMFDKFEELVYAFKK